MVLERLKKGVRLIKPLKTGDVIQLYVSPFGDCGFLNNVKGEYERERVTDLFHEIKTRKEDKIKWTPDKSQIATFEKNTIKNSETIEFCAGMVIGSLGVMVLYYLREVVLSLLKV